MDHSRYSRYTKYRHPSDKRTRRLYGEKEDANRWYKCWNCGFHIDAQRTARGGQGSGIVYQIATDPGYVSPVLSGDPTSLLIAIDDGKDMTLMELGPDGSERVIVNTYIADGGGGCPLCGTRNWA